LSTFVPSLLTPYRANGVPIEVWHRCSNRPLRLWLASAAGAGGRPWSAKHPIP
jgi:hypothetical protein